MSSRKHVAYRNPAFEFDSIAPTRADDSKPRGRNGRENLYGDTADDVVIGKDELFDKYFKSNDGSILDEDNEQYSAISKTFRDTGYRKSEKRFVAAGRSSINDDVVDDEDNVNIRQSGKWELAKLKSCGDKTSSAMTSRQSVIDSSAPDIDSSRSGGKSNRRTSGERKHRPSKHRESPGVSGKTEDGVEQQHKLTSSGQALATKNTGTGSNASQHTSQRSTLRSCVYYQNRFIVLDSHEGRRSAEGYTNNFQQNRESRDKASNSARAGDRDSNQETSFNTSKRQSAKMSDIQRKPGNRRNMEMDASSVTMDARGIEIILTDPENSSRHIAAENKEKNNTIWKKINRLLQDNRMKGNPDSDRILNTDHPEEYRVLKKVLNLSFLTIGILLFLAVIIVVIYAFVGLYVRSIAKVIYGREKLRKNEKPVGDPPDDPNSPPAGDTTTSLKT